MDALTLPHMAHGTATCSADVLNVRTAPNTVAQIIGQLGRNQRVIVWALDHGWMIIQSDAGLTGWSSAQYLRVDGELAP